MLIKARFRFPEVLFGLLLAVAIFAMGATFWSSRQPPSAEQNSASQQQTEKKSGEDGKEAQSLWVPTDSVGLYTLVLCVFTGVLAIVSIFQGFMLLRSDNTARIAANAANLSARAAIAVQLPIIRAEPNGFGYGSSMDGCNPRVDFCVINFLTFPNVGPTKAFPVEVQCGWHVGDELPNEPVYTDTKAFPADVILTPGVQYPHRIYINDFRLDFADGEKDRIRQNTLNLWFFCRIGYLDFMQVRHEAGFCWQRHEITSGGVFLADATPAYNRKT